MIDADYAPVSTLVPLPTRGARRMWLNISQEAKSDIDKLREVGLIHGLKLSTEEFQPITAYSPAPSAFPVIQRMRKKWKKEVEAVLYEPGGGGWGKQGLLHVKFDDGEGVFYLQSLSGYRRTSKMNVAEDVSYVSSPFLPVTLRRGSTRDMTNNKDRAWESGKGSSGIQDELSEEIQLSEVRVLVAEYIPFGSNQIVALNERLGSADRCKGGLFTATMDKNPTGTNFSVPAGLTSVEVLEFDMMEFINFEAEINYPEEEGIVQIENFGMHINVDGTMLYGMKIEAILERQSDDISLDHLARVLVDVQQDSSQIINDLLTAYQRNMLDVLYSGDAPERGKYNMIIAERIHPKMNAKQYMDRGRFENETKQIIGDFLEVHDLSPSDILIAGHNGLLIAGPNAVKHEELLLCYLALLAKNQFIRNFFVRIFVLEELLRKTRHRMELNHENPNNITVRHA